MQTAGGEWDGNIVELMVRLRLQVATVDGSFKFAPPDTPSTRECVGAVQSHRDSSTSKEQGLLLSAVYRLCGLLMQSPDSASMGSALISFGAVEACKYSPGPSFWPSAAALLFSPPPTRTATRAVYSSVCHTLAKATRSVY